MVNTTCSILSLDKVQEMAMTLNVQFLLEMTWVDSRLTFHDLKPGNVLVSLDRRPHILDFGVARGGDDESSERLTEKRTQAGEIVGTLAYMSPEQAAGDPNAVGVEADIYALGRDGL